MGARINARLDDALARRLKRVQAATHKSVTAIVSESIARYCDEVLKDEIRPARLLRASGFIGSGEGPADLSVTYKHELTRSLGRKA